MKKIWLVILFTVWGNAALSAPDDGLLYDKLTDPRFCDTADEFRNSYLFLIKQSDLGFTEPQAVKGAIKIAKNCTGAFDRFSQVFRVLQKSGVDIKKTFDVALEYSSFDSERARNFYVLFQRLFLENYLDIDFTTAYRISHELSKDYKGDPAKLRDDFVKIVKYCTDDKEFGLGKKLCMELALKLTKYTELYPKGLYQDFQSFMTYIQTNKRLGFSLKEALNLAVRVLSKGPKAPRNFKKTIDFALDKGDKLNLPELQAFQLALIISDHSFDPTKKAPEPEKPVIATVDEKKDEKNLK
ncbi:MAG: hypothetical protein JNL11_04730 [Bdellovibrionaceae bacterium]|nr:hypothetical protein [Pseudobdellovibrionaceae bacterium]